VTCILIGFKSFCEIIKPNTLIFKNFLKNTYSTIKKFLKITDFEEIRKRIFDYKESNIKLKKDEKFNFLKINLNKDNYKDKDNEEIIRQSIYADNFNNIINFFSTEKDKEKDKDKVKDKDKYKYKDIDKENNINDRIVFNTVNTIQSNDLKIKENLNINSNLNYLKFNEIQMQTQTQMQSQTNTKLKPHIENKNKNENENENENLNQAKSPSGNYKELNAINYNYNNDSKYMHMKRRKFESINLNTNLNTNENRINNNNRLSLDKIDIKRGSFIKENNNNIIDWNFSPKCKTPHFSSIFLNMNIEDNFRKTINNGFSPLLKNNNNINNANNPNNNNTNKSNYNFNKTFPFKTSQNFFDFKKSLSSNINNINSINNFNNLNTINTTSNNNNTNTNTNNDFSKTMGSMRIRNSNLDWRNFLSRLSAVNLNLNNNKSKNEDNIQLIMKNFELN
jgi:hypothetical protein